MDKNKYVLCSVLGLSLTLSINTLVQANESNWYGGVAVGTSKVDTGVTGTTGTASLDETGNGFKLTVGKKIDKTISVEGFYADFGSASLTGNNGDTFVLNNTTWVFNANNASIKSSAKGFGANAKFSHHFNEKSSILGRVGLMSWNVNMTVSGSNISTSSLTTKGTDLFYGIGYKHQLTNQYALTLDYDVYNVDTEQLNMMSIGVLYNF